jgi:hypothetical protein
LPAVLCTTPVRTFATAQRAVLDRNMGATQWYIHLSRQEGAALSTIKSALAQLRTDCDASGVNLTIGLGPSLLPELVGEGGVPENFGNYEGYSSCDGSGKEAKATQEELLVWVNSNDKGACWKAQYDFRKAVEGHMKVRCSAEQEGVFRV